MTGGIGRIWASVVLVAAMALTGKGMAFGADLSDPTARQTLQPTDHLSQEDRTQLVRQAVARSKAYLLQQGHVVSRNSVPVVSVENGAAIVHFDAFSNKEQLFKVSVRFSGRPGRWTVETIGVLTGEH